MAFSIFGIEFAPFSIPVKRRLQTLAVAWFVSQFIILCFLQVAFLVYLIFTPYYYLPLLYLVWYIYDFKTCERGGRRCHWLRNSPIFKYFADYFPVKLIKTVDLPSDRNYIFASHPHGIFSFSHFVNYCTEGTNFSKTFPGLLPHMITLKYQFMLPLHRDLFSASGACSASRESIDYLLSKKGTGNVVSIIIGGAREVLKTFPNTFSLVLKKRKGFCRLALKHGASLVPVISFGENNPYNTLHNKKSAFNRFEEIMLNMFGSPFPIIFGRGIFQYSFGMMPHRKPITTVVGAPIEVVKNANPSQEDIDQLHQEYIKQLRQLYDEHKGKYGHENVTLEI